MADGRRVLCRHYRIGTRHAGDSLPRPRGSGRLHTRRRRHCRHYVLAEEKCGGTRRMLVSCALHDGTRRKAIRVRSSEGFLPPENSIPCGEGCRYDAEDTTTFAKPRRFCVPQCFSKRFRMRAIELSPLSVVVLVAAVSTIAVSAERPNLDARWAEKLFGSTQIDFGSIPIGLECTPVITITNVFKVPIHIANVPGTALVYSP